MTLSDIIYNFIRVVLNVCLLAIYFNRWGGEGGGVGEEGRCSKQCHPNTEDWF